MLLLSITQVTLAVNIDLEEIEFDLTPSGEINQNTYLPLDQLQEQIPIEIIEISEERTLVYYRNGYYIIEIGEDTIETNSNNIKLKNEPLEINNHLLIPLEFVADCLNISLNLNPNLKRPRPITAKELETEIFLEENVVKNMGKVYLLLKNKSNREQVLNFSSGQTYDFIIRNQYGSIVHKWSKGKFFTQAFNEVKLKPGESVLYDQKLKINKLKPGTYYIQGKIKAKNRNILTKKVKIIVR
jgi:hypothetical protein